MTKPNVVPSRYRSEPFHSALPRRTLLLSLAAGTLSAARAGWAHTVRRLSLAELVHASEHVALITPIAVHSTWAEVDGRRRIVTYSTVRVEEALTGSPLQGPILLQTLGGVVDGIGQRVHDEAAPRLDRSAVSFLDRLEPDLFRITAMNQGYYDLSAAGDGLRRLQAAPDAIDGADERCAVMRLHGQTVSACATLVQQERER